MNFSMILSSYSMSLKEIKPVDFTGCSESVKTAAREYYASTGCYASVRFQSKSCALISFSDPHALMKVSLNHGCVEFSVYGGTRSRFEALIEKIVSELKCIHYKVLQDPIFAKCEYYGSVQGKNFTIIPRMGEGKIVLDVYNKHNRSFVVCLTRYIDGWCLGTIRHETVKQVTDFVNTVYDENIYINYGSVFGILSGPDEVEKHLLELFTFSQPTAIGGRCDHGAICGKFYQEKLFTPVYLD